MTTGQSPPPVLPVLDEGQWRARAAAHRTRVERWTGPHRERRRLREPHPVLDFLFTYYSLRPQRLEQCPATAAGLLRAARVGHGVPQRHATPQRRAAAPGCGGRRGRVAARAVHPPRRVPVLHRGGPPPQRDHAARADQIRNEQPGCLHATMDLYKWAYKLAPATPSELLADCFEPAVDVRELDMRASPYDLTGLGYAPVPIETPAGRAAA